MTGGWSTNYYLNFGSLKGHLTNFAVLGTVGKVSREILQLLEKIKDFKLIYFND